MQRVSCADYSENETWLFFVRSEPARSTCTQNVLKAMSNIEQYWLKVDY